MRKLAALLLILALASGVDAGSESVHGFALNGDVKYKKGFTHFEYANPYAPKGGLLRRASTGTFDSLNPFVIKGVAADGLGYVFESLCAQSLDEPFSIYGLIADEITIPHSNKYVEFRIDSRAKFHDGVKIKPEDVIFSFNILITKGIPTYRKYYEDVVNVKKVGKNKVRFEFKSGENPELPLILSQLSVLPKHYYEKNNFNSGLTPPLGSGPYKIKSYEAGKYIEYKRVKNYWGKDLPVNRGFYNFDEISYDYFRDAIVALEAFKAGEFDFRMENTAKSWATRYTGPQFDKKEILKEEISHENSSGMQGFVFNMRKDIFKDIEFRKALVVAFDFEWINKNLFYGQYKRSVSFFSNSELASFGLPSTEEERILEPYRDRLPDEVFTKKFSLPVNDGSGNNRKALRKASKILNDAGYIIKNGKRINKFNGKEISIEFLLQSPAFERVGLTYKQSLKRLGINLTIRRVDDTQYYNRIRNFDFDMITAVFPQSQSPGNEQRYFWGGKAAHMNGSRNFAGIQDPVVDDLIEKLISARGRKNLVNHCRALDRVLLWKYILVPHWHLDYYRVAYRKGLKHSNITPKFGLAVDTWWWEK